MLLLGDEDLAAQTVQAFAILGVFHKADHWPSSLLNDKWRDSQRAPDQETAVDVHRRGGASPAPKMWASTVVGAGAETGHAHQGGLGHQRDHGHQGTQEYTPRFWNLVRNLLQFEVVVRNRISGPRGRAPRRCRHN